MHRKTIDPSGSVYWSARLHTAFRTFSTLALSQLHLFSSAGPVEARRMSAGEEEPAT
jgi:hypothetical protein